MLKIESLKTEYQTNPVGIDCLNPKFSWLYAQGKNILQKSYRIQVSSDKDSLYKNSPGCWDSGTVNSSLSAGVEYAGKPLLSMTVYHVRLTAMSQDNIEAEAYGTFETALLNESDWKGKWVSMPVNFQGGAIQFRKAFETGDKKIKRARAYIAGIGYHELYINGSLAGGGKLAPAVSEYSKTVYYMTYDIGDFLNEKTNVIGIMLGHGWFGDRKLLAQLYIIFEDGSVWEDHTANGWGWWVSGSPLVKDSIYGGEVYDARIEDKYRDWTTNKYVTGWDNGWMYTVLTAAPQGKKRAQNINPIRICGDYPALSINTVNGNYIYDIGQNIAGWVKIKVRGGRGAKIIMRFGEGLKKDGSVNQLNLRSADNCDVYILNGGAKEEIWEPRFTFHGFRYIEVEIKGGAQILELVGRHVHSDVDSCGKFDCSDEILNKLHLNAVITEANNLYGIMSDCPQRDERFGWLNDLSSRIYQTVCNFSMERFFPKVINDITETQNALGEIADTAPYFTGAQPADPVSVCYLLFSYACYNLYGNKQVLKEYYPNLKAWVQSLLDKQEGYIMKYYYYGDWVPPAVFKDTSTDGLYVSSVYLYWHLFMLAKIAGALGYGEDKEKYGKMAEESQKALNAKYFNGKGYSTESQAANSMALSLGIAGENSRGVIAKNVAEDIIKRGCHSTCGNQGYRHLFYSMTEEGYVDLLIDMIKNPEYPGWGHMIACGATTVWERWESEMANEMHSFDHPMFGSYDGWFYNYLGGINIDKDAVAADSVIIKPYVPKTLGYVNCKITTLKGDVISSWKKDGGKVIYGITIPPNTKARIMLQGKIISVNSQSMKCKTEYGRDCLDLLSGNYNIITG